MTQTSELRLPAIAFRQSQSRTLFTFVAQGRDLPDFITVSRIERDEHTQISGYQRPEVLAHIAEIRSYLESEGSILPNALVVAFNERVRFEPIDHEAGTDDDSRYGTVVIPIAAAPDHEKPGWMVDGQQRMAALREAQLQNFEVCIVGFIAAGDEEQREQFILVNSTKPLPKGLIYELLPTTTCRLPSFLEGRKFPAQVMERLNYDEDSPMYRRIKSPTNPDGVIKDNSVLRMIEHSLSDGVLYRFRDLRGDEHNVSAMLQVLKAYWQAIAEVFPEAWAQPPLRSRLTHGAGIVGMGYLMDAIADRHRRSGLPTQAQFSADLDPMRQVCRWTDGYWEFGPGAQRRWNEIQNTFKDIQLLTNYLMIQYKTLVWNRTLKHHRRHRA